MADMRKAYGNALAALGREDKRIVTLEADLGKSTMSNIFGEEFPERYFQMGIAEANMISVAAGLALTGHIAYANSFAVFASGRPYDQIRSSVCIPKLNVKICGSSAGLSDFGDGKTHQSVDDIALMRVLPNMKVLSPADAYETELMTRAMASVEGPCYMRLNRNEIPDVLDRGKAYAFGKANMLRDGSDAVIFATGYMTYLSLGAAEALEKEGISARVVNVGVIKPLDKEGVCRLTSNMKCVVTAEEASVIGGLGGAICEALTAGGIGCAQPVTRVGIEDAFGTSAQSYDELLAAYHLTSGDIARKVRESLEAAQGGRL